MGGDGSACVQAELIVWQLQMRDRLVCGTTRAVQLDSSSARKVRSLNCRGPWEPVGRGGSRRRANENYQSANMHGNDCYSVDVHLSAFLLPTTKRGK